MYIGERFPVVVPSIGESVLRGHFGRCGWSGCSGEEKQESRAVQGSRLGTERCRVHGYDVAARQYCEGSTRHPGLQRELATTSRRLDACMSFTAASHLHPPRVVHTLTAAGLGLLHSYNARKHVW